VKKVSLHHTTQQAQIVIISPTAGACSAIIPATVAAVIVWFLSCLPAMAFSVVVFRQAIEIRRWLKGWQADLGLIWVALQMTVRLEFA
jgi:hypothetical protein